MLSNATARRGAGFAVIYDPEKKLPGPSFLAIGCGPIFLNSFEIPDVVRQQSPPSRQQNATLFIGPPRNFLQFCRGSGRGGIPKSQEDFQAPFIGGRAIITVCWKKFVLR